MVRHHHSFGRESFIAGAIGGTVVAVWFLILDLIAGHPLATPNVLAQVIILGRDNPVVSPISWPAVLAYTTLHGTVFLVFGMVVTWLVFKADQSDLAIFALFMLFVVFEAFFYGLVTALWFGTSTLFPAWKILAANALAAVGMAGYLIARHPALRRRLARHPLGA